MYSSRCGGVMVSVLISESNSPCSSPGLGHCVVFLEKDNLLSLCLSLLRYITWYW